MAPTGTGALAHSLPNSPSASQLPLQLKQDLAKLAHNDPDTRRSSLEALKGFIEQELDARSMPSFLEQVSGETGKSSGSYAISLFVEVARVHKQAIVPFIPRIMAAVLRTLASSSGGAGHGNNLHQACAKVVSAVARYAIEPTPSATRSSSSTDVLDSLCQPLLGLLSSNVEPVAVGSAACLQSIIEAENWKLAAPGLVHDVCCRSSISLVEKGKHSVAHMHLVRSLAKFNDGALQEYDGSLLKVGVHVLCAIGGNGATCGSWQQRVAAAQLLGTLLGCLDQRALPSEFLPTTKALERCRLDKSAKVRQAVGEALFIAKRLASQIDPTLLRESGSEASATVSSPAHSRQPEPRKQATRKKNLWKAEESYGCPIATDASAVVPQESQLASYTASPSSSVTTLSTPSLGSLSPPSTGNSSSKIGRSPLHPAKQSPVFPPSSIDRYMTESDLPFLLARMKSSDFKENTPLVARTGEPLLSSKSDDVSHLLQNSRNKVRTEVGNDDDDAVGHGGDNACTMDNDEECLLAEDCTEMNTPGADSSSESDPSTDNWDRDLVNFSRGGACKHNGFGRDECVPSFQRSDAVKDGGEGKLANRELDRNSGYCADRVIGSFYTSFNGSVNHHEAALPQVTRNSAEDFLIFSTPRKLVRSLQSVSSTPESKCSPDRKQGLDFDCETLSESGWSVRDNPIAGENEDDSPKRASLSGGRDMLTKSMEGLLIRSCHDGSSATQEDDERTATCFGSADYINSAFDMPMSGHSHASRDDISNWNTSADGVIPSHDSRGDISNWNTGAHGVLNHSSSNHPNGSGKLSYTGASKEYEPVSLLNLRRSRKWFSCARLLRKIHFYLEACLFGALLLVLAFTTFIAILRIKGQQDLHMLVPT